MNNNIFQELKKRKVFRSAAIYGGAAFVILQICSIVFPALLLPDWSIRFLVILLIAGFPFVIIFSWMYDMTNEGVVKTESRGNSDNKFIGFTIILFVILVLLYNYKDDFFKPAVNPKSIAVIPFDNFSQSKDDEYLSSGFTEVIIANLAKVKDLMVISRTSVMRYKNTKMSLKDIAKELNVAHILEGSVQRTENKIRVVGQLIEASTDRHVWAETYDEEFDNIFSIQTSISKEIALALKSTITSNEQDRIEKKLTDNIVAYKKYLQVKDLEPKDFNFSENYKLRIQLIDEIIKLDSQFAEAFSLRSLEASNAVMFGYSKDMEKDKILSKENIEKAFSLDPESGKVRNAYGWHYYACHRNYEKAIEHYTYALSKEPGDAETNARLGFAHRRLGNQRECIKYLEKAHELNPNHFLIFQNLYSSYFFYKHYEKIDLNKYYKDFYRIDPNNPKLYYWKARFSWWLENNTTNAKKIIEHGSNLFGKDKYDIINWDINLFEKNYKYVLKKSIDNLEKNKDDPFIREQIWILTYHHPLSVIYWHMGDEKNQKKEAQKALSLMLTQKKSTGDPRYHCGLAYAYAFAGNKDDAIREIEMALALCPPSKDELLHTVFKKHAADIYAVVGEYDKSLYLIENLLFEPSNAHWGLIKFDYVLYKIFKDNSRFNNLVSKDETRFKKEAIYD